LTVSGAEIAGETGLADVETPWVIACAPEPIDERTLAQGKKPLALKTPTKTTFSRTQTVVRGAKPIGKGALRVVLRAKCVRNETMRVSNGDRLNGVKERSSDGMMQRSEA
jgi:hypothetical protein